MSNSGNFIKYSKNVTSNFTKKPWAIQASYVSISRTLREVLCRKSCIEIKRNKRDLATAYEALYIELKKQIQYLKPQLEGDLSDARGRGAGDQLSQENIRAVGN